MIRVLHSVSNMDRAGIETMLMNYYRHMDRSKIQFDFLCNKQKIGAYEEEIRGLGGRIFRTPGLNPVKYPQYMKFMKKLLQENMECQIVEAHNGALGAYALNAARHYGVPVRILHAHGASIHKDWKLPLKLFCRALLPLSTNHRFSCGAAAAKCYFGAKREQEKDYVLIPNAIEIERFTFNEEIRNKLRKENGLEEKHVIGHVGRFSQQKNQSFLLEAFAHLIKQDPTAYLVFIGDGEDMAAAKATAERLKIADSVRFLGNIPNVNEWYQAFDAFVLPSMWEGLPVVGVEAQAADLPCVFSASVTREIHILEKTRFVDLKAGPKAWADAISKALDNTQRENVGKLIADHGYDISVEAVKLQERYLKLAGESNENRNPDPSICQ